MPASPAPPVDPGRPVASRSSRATGNPSNPVARSATAGLLAGLGRISDGTQWALPDCGRTIATRHRHSGSASRGRRRDQTAPRSLYVYRNRFWNKPGVGSHVYFHYNPNTIIPDDDHARIFIYHNSFAGGQAGPSVSGWADELGGLPATMVVNNVFSTGVAFWAARTFIGGESMMGVFDHNWLGGGFKTSHPGHDYTTAPWYGKQNVLQKGASLWDASEMPDFELPKDGPARLTGLNLGQSNELGDRKFGPLLGMEVGNGRHIGAY